MTKNKKLKQYPSVVCFKCGINASKGKSFAVSTYHIDKCDVCGKVKSVTEPRDYYYPKFEGHKP